MKIESDSLMNKLQMLKGINGPEPVSPKGGDIGQTGATAPTQSFGEMLLQKYEETNNLGVQAEQAIQRSILGEDDNPHEAVIAVQKASVSLSLMMGVKERLERAYQDLIKTPI